MGSQCYPNCSRWPSCPDEEFGLGDGGAVAFGAGAAAVAGGGAAG